MKLTRPLLSILLGFSISTTTFASVGGWLNWRGPNQNGSSEEKNLPSTLDVKQALWTADFAGMSTPVIANGKLYIMGYVGEGAELLEGVSCYDAETGNLLWRRVYPRFFERHDLSAVRDVVADGGS